MYSYFKIQNLSKTFKQNLTFFRQKHKENHWSVVKKRVTSAQKALDHFDELYNNVFESNWPLLRRGLLAKQKYVAIVNNFSDNEETCKFLENLGAINVRSIFNSEYEFLKERNSSLKRKQSLEKIWESENKDEKEIKIDEDIDYKNNLPNVSLERSLQDAEFDTSRIIDPKLGLTASVLHEFLPATKIMGREDFIPESTHINYYNIKSDFPINIIKEYNLNFPPHLNVYCREEDNKEEFPQPKPGSTRVLNYYLMDGGSLLPVLALDLKPKHKMLDMCCAPGGKSLIALQTLYPDVVVCNDVSMSRTNRISDVMKQYLYDLSEKWINPGKIRITCDDARFITEDNFDRILVDVPCTTDRHSVKEDDNNIFRADRIKERIKLPELQCEILYNALKLVRVGGVVVYSTCSLSPIQNDGVVHMTLKKLWETTNINVTVKDLSPALEPFKNVYKMAPRKLLRYGHLILPYPSQNYGPTYLCKLQRLK